MAPRLSQGVQQVQQLALWPLHLACSGSGGQGLLVAQQQDQSQPARSYQSPPAGFFPQQHVSNQNTTPSRPKLRLTGQEALHLALQLVHEQRQQGEAKQRGRCHCCHKRPQRCLLHRLDWVLQQGAGDQQRAAIKLLPVLAGPAAFLPAAAAASMRGQ